MSFTLKLWINILLWPVLHVLCSRIALARDLNSFARSHRFYSPFAFEKGGKFYEKVLKIRKWKHLLPDGGKLMGSDFSKNKFEVGNAAYILRFYHETFRAEWAHWLCIFLGLILLSFNTLKIWLVMLIYALLANLPCIVTQRYNRFKLREILRLRGHLQD